MKPVLELGKMDHWICPPRRGTNCQAVELADVCACN